MSALSEFPMRFFKFPLKKTSQLDIDQRVKQHGFAKSWNRPLCQRLSSARRTYTDLLIKSEKKKGSTDIEALRASMNEYLSILGGFMWHVENFGGAPSPVRGLVFFYWTPLFAAPTNYAANNAFYEAANVLASFALCLLSWSAEEVLKPGARAAVEKACYSANLEAAGLLNQASQWLREYPAEQAPPEMSADFFSGLALFAQAQAHELGCLKAVLLDIDRAKIRDKVQPQLITRLMHQGSLLYGQARESVASSGSVTTDAGGVFLAWCEAKEQAYLAAAWAAQGIHCNQSQDNGSAMRCEMQAMQVAQTALQLAKRPKKSPKEIAEFCNKVLEEAASKKQKYESENSVIFHAKVADVVPTMLAPQVLARPSPYTFPQLSSDWTPATLKEFVLKPDHKPPPPAGGGGGGSLGVGVGAEEGGGVGTVTASGGGGGVGAAGAGGQPPPSSTHTGMGGYSTGYSAGQSQGYQHQPPQPPQQPQQGWQQPPGGQPQWGGSTVAHHPDYLPQGQGPRGGHPNQPPPYHPPPPGPAQHHQPPPPSQGYGNGPPIPPTGYQQQPAPGGAPPAAGPDPSQYYQL